MKKPKNIEKDAKLLKGTGADAWFYITKENDKYRIKRYSEDGELDCSRIFKLEQDGFDIDSKYEFTYVSNCKECRILQNNIIYLFKTNEY
tara:strand:- start:109 stop:378 length:270 start_codon:yes stop_codon:yes gene_type:complete